MRLGLRRGNEVERLVDGHAPLDAIDVLTEANRDRRDPAIARRLIQLRHEAFATLEPAGAPTEAADISFDRDSGLPAVTPDALDAATARAGIEAGGSLLVRGLLDADQVAVLVAATDRALAARDARDPERGAGNRDGWFEPFQPAPDYAESVSQEWNRLTKGGGTLWAADSPLGLFELLEVLDACGLRRLAGAYLGARPVLSMKKCNLRRTAPQPTADWHQDGAFLGGSLGALNVWAALSPCGVDAPGLDIVAKRIDRVVETGTEGANFDWTVGHDLAARLAEPEGIVRPKFEPGDVLLFDELCLHRTGANEDMANSRHAVEVWMFAGDGYPQRQVPLVY